MSSDEKDEIIGYLKAVLSLLKWFGGVSLTIACSFIAVVVADHYDLRHIKKDVDWMKPKVEQIWYNTFTDNTKK